MCTCSAHTAERGAECRRPVGCVAGNQWHKEASLEYIGCILRHANRSVSRRRSPPPRTAQVLKKYAKNVAGATQEPAPGFLALQVEHPDDPGGCGGPAARCHALQTGNVCMPQSLVAASRPGASPRVFGAPDVCWRAGAGRQAGTCWQPARALSPVPVLRVCCSRGPASRAVGAGLASAQAGG